mmetsp:Transcript_11983/g.26505  ORF Transcript_11983/g.26505 Transcript_11983/m.26505 type:complete len:313 (-) Transcript_11983:1039-1977(-)
MASHTSSFEVWRGPHSLHLSANQRYRPLQKMAVSDRPRAPVVNRRKSAVEPRRLERRPERSEEPNHGNRHTDDLGGPLRNIRTPLKAVLQDLRALRPARLGPSSSCHEAGGLQLHVRLPHFFRLGTNARHVCDGDDGVLIFLTGEALLIVLFQYNFVHDVVQIVILRVVPCGLLLFFLGNGDGLSGVLLDLPDELFCLHPSKNVHVQHGAESQGQPLAAHCQLRPRDVEEIEHPHAVRCEAEEEEEVPGLLVYHPQDGGGQAGQRGTGNQYDTNQVLQSRPRDLQHNEHFSGHDKNRHATNGAPGGPVLEEH